MVVKPISLFNQSYLLKNRAKAEKNKLLHIAMANKVLTPNY